MVEAPARSRRLWPWLALLVLGLCAGGATYAWRTDERVRVAAARVLPAFLLPGKGGATKTAGADPAKAAPAAVPVTVATAELGDFPVVLVGLGTAEANNTVLVRSRVDGQINKINFDEGQVVNKGDVLALIDPRPYRAALEQAQAKKAQDQANLANVQRDLGRVQSLAKSNFATTQQVDTQTSQAAQLTAQIAADQAAVDNAQTQLDYTTIKAPLTGRVGFRLTDQGNIVNASGTTGIVEIAELQPIAVIFTEPENALPQLQAGLKAGAVPVAAYSSDGKTLLEEGRLDTFNNTVDASSGTIRLKALFDNKDNRLWPGLSVTTRTTVAVRRNVVIVPDTAVQRGQKGFYAYVVGADDTVQVRPLKLGMIGDARALIEDGIKAGERVVVAGQYRLKPGVPVAVGGAKTASAE
ncbi:MAG: efflux RND transporter periplasmic adaptor subunit, partial [Actinomycetospora chiangmaiensis]|nr:efflux RND transporter periplasmic adaptor subunit [Actinomycetospora chiangmaiensis]